MPSRTGIMGVFVAGVVFSMAACAPPTPKVQQRPAAVPQSIEQKPQSPVREVEQTFCPMVREGSVTSSARHG